MKKLLICKLSILLLVSGVVIACDKQDIGDAPKSNMRSIIGFTVKPGYNVGNIFVNHQGVIDQSNKTITIELPNNIDMTKIRPEIVLSPYTTVTPGNIESVDFSQSNLEYTAIAQSGKVAVYSLIVKNTYKYKGNTMYAISFPDVPFADGTIPRGSFANNNAIVTVPAGTDISKLRPLMELAVDSKNATFSKDPDTDWNFAIPADNKVKFQVISQTGSAKWHAVTVVVSESI